MSHLVAALPGSDPRRPRRRRRRTWSRAWRRSWAPRNVISDAADLRTYECDALTSFRARPSLVVLPASTDEVVAVMKVAREAGMPIVPRGAGTGLSGGALPTPGSLVLALSRMTKILDVDFDNGLMRVQPGVINLDVSRHLGARAATTTRRIRRRRACARSAATSPRTPAARTA